MKEPPKETAKSQPTKGKGVGDKGKRARSSSRQRNPSQAVPKRKELVKDATVTFDGQIKFRALNSPTQSPQGAAAATAATGARRKSQSPQIVVPVDPSDVHGASPEATPAAEEATAATAATASEASKSTNPSNKQDPKAGSSGVQQKRQSAQPPGGGGKRLKTTDEQIADAETNIRRGFLPHVYDPVLYLRELERIRENAVNAAPKLATQPESENQFQLTIYAGSLEEEKERLEMTDWMALTAAIKAHMKDMLPTLQEFKSKQIPPHKVKLDTIKIVSQYYDEKSGCGRIFCKHQTSFYYWQRAINAMTVPSVNVLLPNEVVLQKVLVWLPKAYQKQSIQDNIDEVVLLNPHISEYEFKILKDSREKTWYYSISLQLQAKDAHALMDPANPRDLELYTGYGRLAWPQEQFGYLEGDRIKIQQRFLKEERELAIKKNAAVPYPTLNRAVLSEEQWRNPESDETQAFLLTLSDEEQKAARDEIARRQDLGSMETEAAEFVPTDYKAVCEATFESIDPSMLEPELKKAYDSQIKMNESIGKPGPSPTMEELAEHRKLEFPKYHRQVKLEEELAKVEQECFDIAIKEPTMEYPKFQADFMEIAKKYRSQIRKGTLTDASAIEEVRDLCIKYRERARVEERRRALIEEHRKASDAARKEQTAAYQKANVEKKQAAKSSTNPPTQQKIVYGLVNPAQHGPPSQTRQTTPTPEETRQMLQANYQLGLSVYRAAQAQAVREGRNPNDVPPPPPLPSMEDLPSTSTNSPSSSLYSQQLPPFSEEARQTVAQNLTGQSAAGGAVPPSPLTQRCGPPGSTFSTTPSSTDSPSRNPVDPNLVIPPRRDAIVIPSQPAKSPYYLQKEAEEKKKREDEQKEADAAAALAAALAKKKKEYKKAFVKAGTPVPTNSPSTSAGATTQQPGGQGGASRPMSVLDQLRQEALSEDMDTSSPNPQSQDPAIGDELGSGSMDTTETDQ